MASRITETRFGHEELAKGLLHDLEQLEGKAYMYDIPDDIAPYFVHFEAYTQSAKESAKTAIENWVYQEY